MMRRSLAAIARRTRQIGLLLTAAVAAAPLAAAPWLEARTGHFVVYSQAGEDSIRTFATKLERFDQGMRRLRDLPDRPEDRANPLIVYVVPFVEDVQKLCRGNFEQTKPCTNIAGFYEPRAAGSVAFTPRSAGSGGQLEITAQAVLFHEYTHHFMYENYSAAYPAWFVEGFAEFNATAAFESDGAIGFGKPALYRYRGLMNGEPLPLTTMLTGDDRPLTREQREGLYGRGWLLTHYLMFEPTRTGQLSTYLKAINNGQPSLEAAQTAFGDLRKLDHDLNNYLHRQALKYLRLAPATVPVGTVTIRALTPGEAALMPVRMRSDRGVDKAGAQQVVVDARRLAAPYPNDPGAQDALTEAEFDAGNDDAADAAADRALAAAPDDRAAMIYKGRIATRRAFAAKTEDPAPWRAARAWYVKANKLEPNYAEPLMLYYQSFLAERTKPTPNAIAGLERAFDLAPQGRQLRLLLARQYLIDGKPKEARAVIAPLAFDPHAAEDNPAKKLLARIDERDASAARAIGAAAADDNGDN